MKLTRRSFVASTAATALIGLRPALAAQEKVIRSACRRISRKSIPS